MPWKPEYPGQTEPLWVWWMPDEPEDGLLGFHTKEDRNGFSRKAPGPFRRRIAKDGKTIRQHGDWRDIFIEEALDNTDYQAGRRYE